MLLRLKSSPLVLVVMGSMPMPICNRFHEKLVNNGKITTLVIFIHQHNVLENKTKICTTVTGLQHITDTHNLNYQSILTA